MDSEKWFKYSFAFQISNIGSEVQRAFKWRKEGNIERSQKFYLYAIELITLTKNDSKNKDKIIELENAEKELVSYFALNDENVSEEGIMNYWDSQIENYIREKQEG